MKRLLLLSACVFLTLGAGVASAATLKPLAGEGAWRSEPIFATAPPGDPRLFVVERGDRDSGIAEIRVVEDGALRPAPFLSIPNVDLDGERGLLSMAFAPDYATSGLFYVFVVADGPDGLDPGGTKGDIRIVEYRRSATDPDLADPASARLVLAQSHPATNHNGGWSGFGPDGRLYFTIGDNSARNNSQRTDNLFGKVMRIDPADPDGAGPLRLTIPADNPYLSTPGARGELYTIGLRNPFRASFAPNGDLTVADVGEGSFEEINVGNLAGKNMGWPGCEGFDCSAPDPAFTEPFFVYSHADGCSVLGGFVVRDPDLTGLTGRYLYGDFCRKDLRTLNLGVPGGAPLDPGIDIASNESLRSFGEDSLGCAYVLTDRNAYRLAADAAAPAACPREQEVPDPPVPPVDETAPDLKLDSKVRFFGRKIAVFATCSKRCTIKAKGAVKAKRRGRQKAVGFRYTRPSKEAEAGSKVKFVLRLKRRPLRNARKVLRSGRRLRAVVAMTASDPSGNAASARTKIRLKRFRPGPNS